MRGKLIFFLLILMVAVGIAGYWHLEKNVYSKEVLKLEILGPSEATATQEVEYIIKFKNNGTVRLENPSLFFEYPAHTLPEEGKSLRESLSSKELGGDIYPGEERIFSFRGRLLGESGSAKTVKTSLVYQPKNLEASYESSTTFTTIIKKVPLTFKLDLPSKIESGKDLSFRLNYLSAADYPLSDLSCQISYPPGFEFLDSVPKALDQTEWRIPILNENKGGRIEIKGRIMGETGAQKIFRAKFGKWQDGEFILLKTETKGIEIVEPSLYISQQINGNPEYTASLGNFLHYEVFFRNVGKEPLMNLVLISRLEGDAFDFDSIKTLQGEFEQGDCSIVWEGRRISKLQFLDIGEEGKVEFWVRLKKSWKPKNSEDENPVLKNKIYLSQARKEFITKINSELVIEQKGYFSEDFFENKGPLPPKVGTTTTYTILWQLKNYYNDIENVKVKATLPKYVNFTGEIFPEDESLTFDPESKEVVWQVEKLEAGIGISKPLRVCAFQIAFKPIKSHKGESPILISEAKISGEDQWTEQILEYETETIDTTLPDDQTVTEKQGIVK